MREEERQQLRKFFDGFIEVSNAINEMRERFNKVMKEDKEEVLSILDEVVKSKKNIDPTTLEAYKFGFMVALDKKFGGKEDATKKETKKGS